MSRDGQAPLVRSTLHGLACGDPDEGNQLLPAQSRYTLSRLRSFYVPRTFETTVLSVLRDSKNQYHQ
jgi:hypothetical protein